VGGGTAAGLGAAWGCPVVAVHHMEGHLVAPMLEDDPPEFPFLALLVSGGHTMLIHVRELGSYTLLGTTLDDAVGEAFDKTAKLLGLGYPGGPALAKLAEDGNDSAYALPRPMLNRPDLDFSFSGLKTAVMLEVRKAEAEGSLANARADIAASFQRAAIETLVGKAVRAAKREGLDRIVVAGGVSANRLLRSEIAERFAGSVYYPRLEFCTDNGAMIAVAGALRRAGRPVSSRRPDRGSGARCSTAGRPGTTCSSAASRSPRGTGCSAATRPCRAPASRCCSRGAPTAR